MPVVGVQLEVALQAIQLVVVMRREMRGGAEGDRVGPVPLALIDVGFGGGLVW